MCGRAWKHRGGARGLDRLRGRGRILDDAADLTHTWSRRGNTPVIRVRGRSQRRFSIAALCCYKPGQSSRLIYRPKRHTDRKSGGRKSFAWTEYRDLLIAAHQQLDGPIVLVWDNLNVHKDRRMRAFIDTHDWITSYHLPSYAPDLNPVEGIWSVLRRTSQANTAFSDPDDLTAGYDTASARSSTAATSSTDASPRPDSHARHHAYNLSSGGCRSTPARVAY